MLFDLVDDGRVAIVTLNRPERMNAYDRAMRDGLYEALTAVRDSPGVRALLLCGNGPAFSTGGDVREFGSTPSPTRAREVRWLRDVWGTLWNLPALTIAAVHGYVVGGGMEMMLLCDLALAARGARFALPETGLAMIPGVGGTQTLPRLAGPGPGLDLVLSGASLDAAAALRLGLVTRVVHETRLWAAARALARDLARLDGSQVQRLKRLVNDAADYPLRAGLSRAARAAFAPVAR